MTIKTLPLLSIACLSFMMNAASADHALTSATITADTLAAIPNCMHYQWVGNCYWRSKLSGISTTPYIKEYLPDVVVSVFNKPDDNPWLEVNETLDQAGKTAEEALSRQVTDLPMGFGQHSLANVHEQNTFFKEADVIGNPALAFLPSGVVNLPSTARPLNPYYQSMTDSLLWRGYPPLAIPEQTAALGEALTDVVGSVGINWGSVHPYEGKIGSSNEAKASAVIAQRATHLLTSADGHWLGHVYQALSTTCGQECQASAVQENSAKTQFQMLYPVESHQCDYFGKTSCYGEEFEPQAKGSYVWVVWRYYEGCPDGDGDYIGKTLWG